MRFHKSYIEDLRLIRKAIPEWERIRGKTVFVTGATGLIGSAVIDFLAQCNIDLDIGIQIIAAGRNLEKVEKRFDQRMEEGGITYCAFDALKQSTPVLPKAIVPDYYIHAAGNANPSLYGTKPVQTMMTTISGTLSLLNMASANPDSRLLFVSSSEIYGKKETAKPFIEDVYGTVDILSYRSCYPISKRAAETLCACFQKEKGVNFVIARPGHVYGPTMTEEDNRASSQFPRDVAMGKDIVLKSKGTQVRSYCYVLDCVSALLTLLLHGKSGCAYNISNRHSIVTIREMAEAFAEAAGRKVIFDIPTDMEQAVFNPMDNSSLNAERLEALGWRGLFDLQTGVEKTLNCMWEELAPS